MAYLKLSDYSLRISIAHLDEILIQAAATSGLTVDQVRENAENLAYAEIKAWLSAKYKITEELAIDSASTSRNALVMKWAIDISLYTIHFTVNPRDVPEIREKAYKMAKEELEASRDATLLPGLAQKDTFYTRHLLGSQDKFTSKEFDLTEFE